MKVLLVIIVALGASHGDLRRANVDRSGDAAIHVEQIEFSSISTCERAAAKLSTRGVVIAECIEIR